MNHALQEATTSKRSGFFIFDVSDTSCPFHRKTGDTVHYTFRGEESSASARLYQSTVIQPLVIYESYREVADSVAEATWGDIFPLMVMPGRNTKVEEPGQPVAASKRNEAAIALLESWLAAPGTGEDDEQLEAFIKRFDEDRLSERKLFQ
jgi:hypothetical protein